MDISYSKMQAQMRALEADAGPLADASYTLPATKEMHIYFRPDGWGSDKPSIFGSGDTFEECLADATRQWEAMRNHVQSARIKALALAIIRITHEIGSCTDASLRAEFDTSDVARYGAEAVTLANTMAERGPFSIIKADIANMAAE